jgi:prepilin signal peptidase PulO-like enzyme (type II secretory pathway)
MSAFAGALLLTAAFGAIALAGQPRSGAVSIVTTALATSAIVVAALAFTGRSLSWPGAAILACASVCASTDVETGYIFDRVLLATLLAVVATTWSLARLGEGAVAATVCGGALLIAFVAGRGRAMGLGDVKLAGTTALALGLHASLDALWFACVSGGGVAAFALLSGRARRGAHMPFGAFIAFGTCAALFAQGVR